MGILVPCWLLILFIIMALSNKVPYCVITAFIPNCSLPSSLISCENLHLVSMAFPKYDHWWFSVYFQNISDVQWYSNRHKNGFPLTFYFLRLCIVCLLAAVRSWQVILSHHAITCFKELNSSNILAGFLENKLKFDVFFSIKKIYPVIQELMWLVIYGVK